MTRGNGSCESDAGTADAARLSGDRTLDAWERSMGLPADCPAAVEVEATRLLQLDPDSLRVMTAAQCGEAAYSLELFALYLQKAANREQARLTRADERLARILPPLLSQRREYMLEERRLHAVAASPEARAVDALRAEARIRLDRLAYLASRVSALARILTELQKTRNDRGC